MGHWVGRGCVLCAEAVKARKGVRASGFYLCEHVHTDRDTQTLHVLCAQTLRDTYRYILNMQSHTIHYTYICTYHTHTHTMCVSLCIDTNSVRLTAIVS